MGIDTIPLDGTQQGRVLSNCKGEKAISLEECELKNTCIRYQRWTKTLHKEFAATRLCRCHQQFPFFIAIDSVQ